MADHANEEDADFEVDRRDEQGVAVFLVAGELDLETAPTLRHRLHQALDGGEAHLVVDLSELSFIDSTGISVLVESLKQAQRAGGSLVLRNPTPAVRRVLDITGLLGTFGLD